MNRFTLKFKDDKVEQQFQKSKAVIKQKALKRYVPLVCLITLIILIHSIALQQFSILIISSIFFILQIVAYYMILRKVLTNNLQPLVMGIILSMIISLQIVVLLDNSIGHCEIDWILDICQLLSINYVLSTDISWNFFFFSLSLTLRLCIRFQCENYSILSMAFIICSFITFYNEYNRILNLRLEFELEEENQSSHNIFDTFQEKSIIILTYDAKTMKFHLKFQNACSINCFQQFTGEFLKTLRISNKTLGRYIFESIKNKDCSVTKLIGIYGKSYFNVTYQVTRSTEIQIFIIITKRQQDKPRLIKTIFYKPLLMKVKKLDQKLFHIEVLKNMMYNIMEYKKSFGNYQIKEIKSSHLLQFFQERFNQARVICHIDHSIYNNLLMIEGAILLIKRYFRVDECTISKCQEIIIVKLQGLILNVQMSPPKRELFQLILLRIGTGSFTFGGSTLSFELIDFKDQVPFK